MELIKDIIKALLEGIIEYKAENKISERRKEYFSHRKGKWPKICFALSLILALIFVVIGLCQIIQKKIIGIFLLCTGIGIGLFMVVEWGTAERK
ncbi:MAG TPA: hypothetical protein H9747_12825 [Candidatus Blautia stercorigallinarum]|uniref:Uncharacterized protein n=1 Tax=Candidatus Blautia stercorigallinarum TaxID=2838501 RepID=A0A9D1TGF0_9FIRM|nr:hypothetical protein [Candidatus Blautia stercorigallinarum]